MDLMDRLKDHLEWLIAQDREWNEETYGEPALFTAHELPGDGGIYLVELPVPERFWRQMPNPIAGLVNLPEVIIDHKQLFLQGLAPGFFAWVFRTEIWMLQASRDAPQEEKDRMDMIAANHEIRHQKDRIEARAYTAASIDKSLLMAMVRRVDRQVDASVLRPGDAEYERARSSAASAHLLRACRVAQWAQGK